MLFQLVLDDKDNSSFFFAKIICKLELWDQERQLLKILCKETYDMPLPSFLTFNLKVNEVKLIWIIP